MDDFLFVLAVMTTVLWYGLLLWRGMGVKKIVLAAFIHPRSMWSLVCVLASAAWLSWAGIYHTIVPFHLFVISVLTYYYTLQPSLWKESAIIYWTVVLGLITIAVLVWMETRWLSVLLSGCYCIGLSVLYFIYLLRIQALYPCRLVWTNGGLLFFNLSQLIIYALTYQERITAGRLDWPFLSILSNWILIGFLLTDMVSMKYPAVEVKRRFQQLPESITSLTK